jgi:hypothetical protein
MSDSCDWLDTQTKAELQGSPPRKTAPPTEAGFSVVLLSRGDSAQRVDRVLRQVVSDPRKPRKECPFVVRSGLSETDALEMQFEFICVDSVAVFVDDQVVDNASQKYLEDLYETLLQSSEFQLMRVHVSSIPPNENGTRLLEQFFGKRQLPINQVVARKKARILEHWATKIGAEVECQDTTI